MGNPPLPSPLPPPPVADQVPALKAIAYDWLNLVNVSPGPWNDDNIEAVCADPSAPALYGVSSCSSDGYVTGLSFSGLDLGPMTPAIGELSMLQTLEFFVGLSGPIEPSWGNLTNLQRLNIASGHGLTGTIPDEWAGLTSLRYFALNDASTMDPAPIPSWFANLPNLQTLSFAQTPLRPPFPAWVANSSSLVSLVYNPSNTDYEADQLPNDWSEATNLASISISLASGASKNQSGPIPSSWPSEIQVVQISNWGLTGSLSDSLVSSSRLVTLDLSNNFLTGGLMLPNDSSSSPLRTFTLSHNSLGGTIPSNALQFPSLDTFLCDSCGLVGPLPEGPESTASSLTMLSLEDNALSGSIPDQWGAMSSGQPSLSKLATLLLSNNSLSSTLPSSLGNITTLALIGISNNNISGTIPDEAKWVLASFLAASNALTGTLPASLLDRNLQRLVVNNNQLNLCQNKAVVESGAFRESIVTCNVSMQTPTECGCSGVWPLLCFTGETDMPATCEDSPVYPPDYFGIPAVPITPTATNPSVTPNNNPSPQAPPTSGSTPLSTNIALASLIAIALIILA